MSQKIGKTGRQEPDVAAIRFLILDVDGVMTDGYVTYTSSGEELKSFNIKDGAGIKYWRRSGHGAGIITGRTSDIVKRRAAELGIEYVEMDAKAKLPAFERMIDAAGVTMDEVAMIGDDLLDLPIIRRVGLGIAVADAVAEVREAAHWTTTLPGGRGAIREAIERILKAQGRWDAIMERYLV
ncbi:MAG: HAD hydrolase family protein [Planctomycetaceae bacterium]|nr:HAD hydrolase family protein [Planctomycetaceae bacterium]